MGDTIVVMTSSSPDKVTLLTRIQGLFLDAIIWIFLPLGIIAAADGWIDAISNTIRELSQTQP